MAKKKKKHKLKRRITKTIKSKRHTKKRSKHIMIAFFAGVALVSSVVYFLNQGEEPPPRVSEVSVLKTGSTGLRENRPTLSPQRFSGTVRMAYEVARSDPEILDQLYCYCRCRENFGHKNLLSCFVDTHAST